MLEKVSVRWYCTRALSINCHLQTVCDYMEQAKAYVVELLSKEGPHIHSSTDNTVESDPAKKIFKVCEDLCTAATKLPLCEVRHSLCELYAVHWALYFIFAINTSVKWDVTMLQYTLKNMWKALSAVQNGYFENFRICDRQSVHVFKCYYRSLRS